jgi:hypothetical protein
MLQIAVINKSTAISDADVKKMIPAFSTQWNTDLKSVWNVGDAAFTFHAKEKAPASDSWWVVFFDEPGQAQALAYHDLTNEGLPIAKVFVKLILADKFSVSVAATHEICEMAVDPWLNNAYEDREGAFWASEVCDPVEDDDYAYKIGGILVADFVTPNWFRHEHIKGPIDFDFRRHAHAAFEVSTGGFAQKFDPKSGWQQITGAKAKNTVRGANPPVGSRRERRARGRKKWTRSGAKWG